MVDSMRVRQLAMTHDVAVEAGEALAKRMRGAYVPLALAGVLPRRRWRLIKRALDLTLTAPLLVCAAPLLLAVSLAVRVRYHRRAIVALPCATRGGRVFRLRQLGANDPVAQRPDAWLSDGRVSRAPALLSVLGGAMSLVGPAPWRVEAFDGRPASELARLSVQPGLLRLRPVGRLGRLARTQAEAELRYVTAGSLWMDIEQIVGAALAPHRRFL
jgi:lipopolysaccharide/colanic/teichoic acid biosynthesis glycosyltransferase